MNALMLTLAVRLSGTEIVLPRVLLGAAAGAVIAQMAAGLSQVQRMMVWLPAAMIMMRIACGKPGRMLAGSLLLLCAAGFVGGVLLAFWGATGSLLWAYVLSGMAAALIGLCAAGSRRTAQHAARVTVICRYRGQEAEFDAMIDSGNTLRDYLTHLPVIVIAQKKAAAAWQTDCLTLRPIYAQTAGGRQRMDVLAPEIVELEIDGARRRVQAMIALSPQMSESVPALVPAALLESTGKSNRGG